MIASIKKHINYVLYGFIGIHILIFLILILRKTTLARYIDIERNYDFILDISNLILAAILIVKYFIHEIKSQHKFFTVLKQNKLFIFMNIVFVTLFMGSNFIEDHIIELLQQAGQTFMPMHIIIYIFSFYIIYSDYSDIYERYEDMKKEENISYTGIFSELIKVTTASTMYFLIISLFLLFLKKRTLALYILNHVNIAFVFIGGTSILFFVSLYMAHNIKKCTK